MPRDVGVRPVEEREPAISLRDVEADPTLHATDVRSQETASIP